MEAWVLSARLRGSDVDICKKNATVLVACCLKKCRDQ